MTDAPRVIRLEGAPNWLGGEHGEPDEEVLPATGEHDAEWALEHGHLAELGLRWVLVHRDSDGKIIEHYFFPRIGPDAVADKLADYLSDVVSAELAVALAAEALLPPLS
jgi:hypothetical protein